MILFIVFLGYLLFFLKGSKMTKISLSLILSLYQLIITSKLAGWLNVERNSFLSLNIRLYDLKQGSLIIILMLLTILIIKNIYNYELNKYSEVGILSMKNIFISLIWFILVFVGSICHYASIWTFDYFGNIGLEEIFYTLSQPLTGSDSGQIISFIHGPLFQSLFIALTITVLYYVGVVFFFSLLKRNLPEVKRKGLVIYCLWSMFCYACSFCRQG